jgi:hypothetical protein
MISLEHKKCPFRRKFHETEKASFCCAAAGIAATCTETGLTEGKHCSVCNEVLVAQEAVAANGHSFSEWSVVKEATRKEAGEESRSCDCGETEIREIPMIEGVDPVIIVVAVVAGLGVAAAAAFVLLKKKQQAKNHKKAQGISPGLLLIDTKRTPPMGGVLSYQQGSLQRQAGRQDGKKMIANIVEEIDGHILHPL